MLIKPQNARAFAIGVDIFLHVDVEIKELGTDELREGNMPSLKLDTIPYVEFKYMYPTINEHVYRYVGKLNTVPRIAGNLRNNLTQPFIDNLRRGVFTIIEPEVTE